LTASASTSTYLARLIGPVLAVVGVSMLLSPSGYMAAVLLLGAALSYFGYASRRA
jgi:hypothetical protein